MLNFFQNFQIVVVLYIFLIKKKKIWSFKRPIRIIFITISTNPLSSFSEIRVKAGADPPTSPSNNIEAGIGIEPSLATAGMSLDKCDPEPLIKNLWGYLVGYLEEQPPPLYLPKPVC